MAVIFSIPIVGFIKRKWAEKERSRALSAVCGAATAICILAVFGCAVSYIVIGSYNPFIYFNF